MRLLTLLLAVVFGVALTPSSAQAAWQGSVVVIDVDTERTETVNDGSQLTTHTSTDPYQGGAEARSENTAPSLPTAAHGFNTIKRKYTRNSDPDPLTVTVNYDASVHAKVSVIAMGGANTATASARVLPFFVDWGAEELVNPDAGATSEGGTAEDPDPDDPPEDNEGTAQVILPNTIDEKWLRVEVEIHTTAEINALDLSLGECTSSALFSDP